MAQMQGILKEPAGVDGLAPLGWKPLTFAKFGTRFGTWFVAFGAKVTRQAEEERRAGGRPRVPSAS
jgi:hypothetical protein